jgi:hypothetical protein
VDFRVLVRDLARTFTSRIALRQIGPRDEAKLLGGIGPCGRVLCCASFLPDYARVSIKMAKDQDLPLNPAKISGVCGRLLCCLSYEHEQYVAMRAELPRKGAWVQTPDGPGEVISQHVLKQQLIVQLASSGMHETYDLDQVVVATTQVAATARARNVEGITPVARIPRPPERERGERRKLRDEIDQYDLNEDLERLEDSDELSVPSAEPTGARPRQGAGAPRRPEARQTPPPANSSRQTPQTPLPAAQPRPERAPKARPVPPERPPEPPALPDAEPAQREGGARRRRRRPRGGDGPSEA